MGSLAAVCRALMLFGGLVSWALPVQADCHGGCPVSQQGEGRVVIREVYVLQNNPITKFADWVAYRVSVAGMTLPEGVDKPTRRWKRDDALDPANTLAPDDYKDAHAVLGTDRGHQAPLASFYGYPDVQATNYLSNITPQRGALNQGPWRILEDKVRDLAREAGTLFVVTGPLYERPMAPLPRARKPHRVPSGYWKVVLRDPDPVAPGDEAVAAFIMDQDLPRHADFCATAVAVDTIEIRGGYDLFPEFSHDEAFEAGPGTLFAALGCPAEIVETAAINARGAAARLLGLGRIEAN